MTAVTHSGWSALVAVGSASRNPTRSRPGSMPTSAANGAAWCRRTRRADRAWRTGDVEHRGGVAHGARHDVLADEEVGDLVEVGTAGDTPAGRLEAHEAAARCRDADRSAAVVGVRDRDHAARDRGSRSAARPTGRVAELPRVVRGSVGVRLGGGQEPDLGGVGPAEHDEAGVDEPLRERIGAGRVMVRVTEEPHALVEGLAGHLGAQVLQQHRHPTEGAVGERAGGLVPGPLEAIAHHRVELRVHRLDPRDRLVHQLGRRRLAAPDQLRLPDCVHRPEATARWSPDRAGARGGEQLRSELTRADSAEPRAEEPKRRHQPRRSTGHDSTTSSPSTTSIRSW